MSSVNDLVEEEGPPALPLVGTAGGLAKPVTPFWEYK